MEIKAQGFTLRGWKESDIPALQRNADNANISSFLLDRFPHPYTMEDAIWWVDLMLKQDPFLNFVIDIDGELAGGIGIELCVVVFCFFVFFGFWFGVCFC